MLYSGAGKYAKNDFWFFVDLPPGVEVVDARCLLSIPNTSLLAHDRSCSRLASNSYVWQQVGICSPRYGDAS